MGKKIGKLCIVLLVFLFSYWLRKSYIYIYIKQAKKTNETHKDIGGKLMNEEEKQQQQIAKNKNECTLNFSHDGVVFLL